MSRKEAEYGVKLRDNELKLLEEGEVISITLEDSDERRIDVGIGYARHRGEESDKSPISVRKSAIVD